MVFRYTAHLEHLLEWHTVDWWFRLTERHFAETEKELETLYVLSLFQQDHRVQNEQGWCNFDSWLTHLRCNHDNWLTHLRCCLTTGWHITDVVWQLFYTPQMLSDNFFARISNPLQPLLPKPDCVRLDSVVFSGDCLDLYSLKVIHRLRITTMAQ